MIWNGRIVRIDIDNGQPGKDEFVVPPVATQEGIRIGSTEKEVKQKYGSKLRISAHPYMDDAGHYMELLANNRRYGLIFETTDDKVINFRAGTARAIKLIEGCS